MSDDAGEDERIVLSMDRTTARLLYDVPYGGSEDWAAGAEIPYPPPEVMARCGYRLVPFATGSFARSA